MLFVALVSAFLSMRLAIHGREVAVPNLANLSDDAAAAAAKKLGLNLSVENRFYSAAIAPNHVLSQSPIAGARVRRGWQVRVTESLGGQKISVPDMTGQTERPASLILRRLQLELGRVVHLPAPAPAGVVLSQSPPPNSVGLDGPRVALLVSDDQAAPSTIAYIMPLINGLTIANANARLSTAGLRISSAQDPAAAPPAPPAPDPNATSDPSSPTSQSASALAFPSDPAIPPTFTAPPPVSPFAIISTQSPAPGRRVSRADAIRVTIAHTPSVDVEEIPLPQLRLTRKSLTPRPAVPLSLAIDFFHPRLASKPHSLDSSTIEARIVAFTPDITLPTLQQSKRKLLPHLRS